jgi:hypothetical protein
LSPSNGPKSLATASPPSATDAAVLLSASDFVGAAVKRVCRAGENLPGELRVVDGARHRDHPSQGRERQDCFASLGVGLGLWNQADEPVDVPYLPAVGPRAREPDRETSAGSAATAQPTCGLSR